jgi:hypothetical protein
MLGIGNPGLLWARMSGDSVDGWVYGSHLIKKWDYGYDAGGLFQRRVYEGRECQEKEFCCL